MEIVEEKHFEDKDGTKIYRKYRVGKDKFLEEVTHLIPSQQFIDDVIKPMKAKVKAKDEEIAREMKIQEKMREMAIKELEKEEDK